MKPRYGVAVHRTPTDEVLLSENKERSMAKGFRIEDIAWLKKRDSALGAAASLGIRFDSPEAAEWALRDGPLFGQRYVGSVEPYENKRKGATAELKLATSPGIVKKHSDAGAALRNTTDETAPPPPPPPTLPPLRRRTTQR